MRILWKLVSAICLLAIWWSPSTSEAQPSANQVDLNYLLGRWTITNNCERFFFFRPDGTFAVATGSIGRYSLSGNRLAFADRPAAGGQITVQDRTAFRLVHPDGSISRFVRCEGSSEARARSAPFNLPLDCPSTTERLESAVGGYRVGFGAILGGFAVVDEVRYSPSVGRVRAASFLLDATFARATEQLRRTFGNRLVCYREQCTVNVVPSTARAPRGHLAFISLSFVRDTYTTDQRKPRQAVSLLCQYGE